MEKIASSFRDPSGFVFRENGILYRKINACYKRTFNLMIQSGLYQELLDNNLIIPHKVISDDIIQPTEIFISYPYEWSFEQYKDAALATLHIQQIALKYDMTLKDATPYNIQFYKGHPVLIDTLSFEIFKEKPWIAYNQFCKMFLAPLSLMTYKDQRLSCLMKDFIDGIPLDLCAKLLPLKSRLNIGLLLNIFSHSKSQQKYADNRNINLKQIVITKKQLDNIITSLIDLVNSFKVTKENTEWGDYYSNTNYTNESFEMKLNTVKDYIKRIKPVKVWDLGGNTNVFSNIAIKEGAEVVSFDIDYMAVAKSYKKTKQEHIEQLLPLVLDLTNPSPGIGWANEERETLISRAKQVDCVMCLALIHHLAISNNLPFGHIAKYFAQLSNNLIIEFVDKQDSQVQKLLFSREDIFNQYTQQNFEKVFSDYFEIKDKQSIKYSYRTLYLMSVKK